MASEKFIQNLLIDTSSTLIIVTKTLTNEGEKLIHQAITRVNKKHVDRQQIIVVHNFYELTSIDEVK